LKGIARIVNGSRSGTKVERESWPAMALISIWPVKVTAAADSKSPRSMAPESPIKIFAG